MINMVMSVRGDEEALKAVRLRPTSLVQRTKIGQAATDFELVAVEERGVDQQQAVVNHQAIQGPLVDLPAAKRGLRNRRHEKW